MGKTTLIRRLLELDDNFRYIKPDMTRPLRDGETDKRSIADEEMDEMIPTRVYIVVNTLLNGIRYATPRQPILDALEQGNFPVLDWPIKKLSIMTKEFPTYTVYLSPPNLNELKNRLINDNRDTDGARLKAAEAELNDYRVGKFENLIDLHVVNHNQKSEDAAQLVYSAYKYALTSI